MLLDFVKALGGDHQDFIGGIFEKNDKYSPHSLNGYHDYIHIKDLILADTQAAIAAGSPISALKKTDFLDALAKHDLMNRPEFLAFTHADFAVKFVNAGYKTADKKTAKKFWAFTRPISQ